MVILFDFLRWNIDAVDMLPEYMKFIYKTLLDVFNEIEDDLAKEGRSYCIPYAKDAVYIFIISSFAFKRTPPRTALIISNL